MDSDYELELIEPVAYAPEIPPPIAPLIPLPHAPFQVLPFLEEYRVADITRILHEERKWFRTKVRIRIDAAYSLVLCLIFAY